jgi:flagellar FliL protein
MAVDEKEPQTEPVKKKSKLGLIIVIFVLLLVLAGGGGAAWFMFLKPKPVDASSTNETQTERPAQQVASSEIGSLYPFEPFVVNLADPGGSRYLRVALQLELSAIKGLKEEIDRRQPQIRDAIITILSAKKYDEINSAQGKMIMKQQIMRSINSLLNTGQIANVYMTDFVIQ